MLRVRESSARLACAAVFAWLRGYNPDESYGVYMNYWAGPLSNCND